jgi:hypothetical protein
MLYAFAAMPGGSNALPREPYRAALFASGIAAAANTILTSVGAAVQKPRPWEPGYSLTSVINVISLVGGLLCAPLG